MSAPHVSGVAALLLQEDHTLTPAQLRDRMRTDAIAGIVTDGQSGSSNLLLNTAAINERARSGSAATLAPSATPTSAPVSAATLAPATSPISAPASGATLAPAARPTSAPASAATLAPAATPTTSPNVDVVHTYTEVTSETCEFYGFKTITDVEECTSAAIKLGEIITWGPWGVTVM